MTDPHAIMPPELKKLAIQQLFMDGGTWHHKADIKKGIPADDPEGSIFRTKCGTFFRIKNSAATAKKDKKTQEDETQFVLGKNSYHVHDYDFFHSKGHGCSGCQCS